MNSTSFAWRCCDAGDFPPPESSLKKFTPNCNVCWLCGNHAENGWPLKAAFGPTFTDHAFVSRLDSNIVCQPCVALTKSEGWAQYVSAHPENGFAATFPEKPGKKPRSLNWLYMSHLFSEKNGHESPSWARWRELLCDPPDPPFMAIFSVMQKQQLIFRGKISHSRDYFHVQVDQEDAWIKPSEFSECVETYEHGMQIGLLRSVMTTGEYTSQHIKNCTSISEYLAVEDILKKHRQKNPVYMILCEKVALKQEKKEVEKCTITSTQMTQTVPQQRSLFT